MQLQDITDLVGGQLRFRSEGDETKEFLSVRSLSAAGPSDIAYISHKKFLGQLLRSQAGLFLVEEGIAVPSGITCISVRNVQQAVIVLLKALYPAVDARTEAGELPFSSSADIHPEAVLYPGVSVCGGVSVGKGSVLYPGVFVGRGCRIGEGCILYPNVVLYHECFLGDNVIIHAGSVIGSDGFGYLPQGDGSRVKIPQVGDVIIEDDVEVGSNVSIDRAALDSTIIKRGTKIDNLVQIAHNVTVGEDNVLCSQVGISGSCTLGSSVILAGQVGLADHVEICDKVMIGAKSGVSSSVRKAGVYSGIPIMEQRLWLRAMAALKKLPEFMKRKS